MSMTSKTVVEAYIDGSCLGNPGKIGAGYLMYKKDVLIRKESVFLGEGTNNIAEYMALLVVLCELISSGIKSVRIYSDSNLLCEQINGNFKVKNKNILPLHVLAKKFISHFDDFSIAHIDREKNKEADKLAKNAIGFLF